MHRERAWDEASQIMCCKCNDNDFLPNTDIQQLLHKHCFGTNAVCLKLDYNKFLLLNSDQSVAKLWIAICHRHFAAGVYWYLQQIPHKTNFTSFSRSVLAPAFSSSGRTSVLPSLTAIISGEYPSCVMTDMCSETLMTSQKGSSQTRLSLHVWGYDIGMLKYCMYENINLSEHW